VKNFNTQKEKSNQSVVPKQKNERKKPETDYISGLKIYFENLLI